MKLPTRAEIEAVRRYVTATMVAQYGKAVFVLCDLATAVLDAPVRELTPSERAVWGACPVCNAKHGQDCIGDGQAQVAEKWKWAAHPARLAAAPTRVRLAACAEGDSTP